MNVYIWGTGRLAGLAYGDIIEEKKISGFIDNDVTKNTFMGKNVYRPEEIKKIGYDAILVITVQSHDIYEQSQRLSLDLDKIIFFYNNFTVHDININYALAEKILGKSYSDIIKNRYGLIRKNEVAETWGREIIADYTKLDYVRIKTFELLSKEIKDREIEGAVAEVGVFKGEFAQYINASFPHKKCYLFDTFEGFSKEEATDEVQKGQATGAMIEAFKDTNVKIVMDKMRYPEMVEIRKGIFPETVNGIEETFCFVSIDVDFKKSTYDCLCYFYPRMTKGGYIFIHDYNSPLSGIKKAVMEYEEVQGEILRIIPLSDANGTLIIAK